MGFYYRGSFPLNKTNDFTKLILPKSIAKMSEPTAKDALFFWAILSSMNTKPDVDWKVIAEKAGLKNANTASTRFNQIKKKFNFVHDNASASNASASNGSASNGSASNGPGSGSRPTKSTPKKTKAGDGPLNMPAKVTKSRGVGRPRGRAKAALPKEGSKVKAGMEQSSDDVEGSPTPKAKVVQEDSDASGEGKFAQEKE
ncbi:hypothetical protein B7494_g5523 [Chlorociboria aeruginascens]|nr:hypothetical protein B7494_g5523 [Chlorociboria aeruginascens]